MGIEDKFEAVRKEVAEKMEAAAKLINEANDLVQKVAGAPPPKNKWDYPANILGEEFWKESDLVLNALGQAGWRTSSLGC